MSYPDDITVIEVNDPDKGLNAEDIFDPESAQLVVLETTPESVMSNIARLSYFENKYYVVDGNMTAVFVFDKDGRYLKKLHNIGKGPNEYIQVSRFTIDPVSRKALLSDGYSRKIFICDLDLNIEKILRIDNSFINSVAYRDDCLLQGPTHPDARNSGNVEYRESEAILFDSTGNIVKTFIPAICDDASLFLSVRKPQAYENDSSVLMIPGFSDIIYEISPSLASYIPKYLLDFKMKNRELVNCSNYLKLVEDKNQIITSLSDLALKKDYAYTGDYIYNTDNHLLVGYGDQFIFCIYDKINKKSKSYYNYGCSLTIKSEGDKGMMTACYRPGNSSGDRMFFSVPVWLWKMDVSPGIPTVLQQISDSINKLDEESNPVILSFKIKEFK